MFTRIYTHGEKKMFISLSKHGMLFFFFVFKTHKKFRYLINVFHSSALSRERTGTFTGKRRQRMRSEANAEMRHRAAAKAHQALTDGRGMLTAEQTAMWLSPIAEDASYKARKAKGG